MYNRYISNSTRYEPVGAPPLSGGFRGHSNAQRPPPPPTRGADPPEGILGGLSGLLKQFRLEKLDSGDILLVLILILLFMEQDDNLELMITLGLLLAFGLFGNEDAAADQSSSSPTA